MRIFSSELLKSLCVPHSGDRIKQHHFLAGPVDLHRMAWDMLDAHRQLIDVHVVPNDLAKPLIAIMPLPRGSLGF